MMRNKIIENIVKANGNEEEIILLLEEFENHMREDFFINLLLEKRNKKISETCWRKKGCPFNSNNSQKYMKCWQEGYSVEKCKEDNYAEWKEE